MEFGKYHFRYYLSSTIVVLCSLLAIIWLNQTLQLLELIVSRGGGLSDFALISVLPLPLWLTIALPLSVFCAVIWTMQRFALDREMLIMQAIGMSKAQLAWPAILFGILTSLFLLVNSLYILPLSFSSFKALQNEIRTSIPKILIKDGEFIDLDTGLTIFIGEKRGRSEIGNVFIQDSRQKDRLVTFTAQSGAFGKQGGRAVLILRNGQRTELSADGGSSALLAFKSHMLDISRSSAQKGARLYRDSNEESIATLLNPRKTLSEKYRRDLIAQGHFRIISPFLPLTLSIIAASFLGQAGADRRRTRYRLLLTIFCGSTIVVLAVIARSWVSANTNLWPTLYLVIALPALMGLVFLYWPKRRFAELRAA